MRCSARRCRTVTPASRVYQLSHGVGIVALAATGWLGRDLSPLWLSILTTAILIGVAIWESLSLRSKPET